MRLNMTTWRENVIMSDEIDGGYFITPRVPQGLAAAVESLTREVIRQRPKDIYIFAAEHFENLLRQREYCGYERNNGGKVVISKFDSGHEWSHDEMAKMKKKYDENKIKRNSMIAPLRRRRRNSLNADITICPKIITKMQTENDVKAVLRRNFNSEWHSRIASISNIDKITGRVINQLANVRSLDDLQEVDYVMKVEEIIDNASGPILNKKFGMLHGCDDMKNKNFGAKLDETRNVLEDISSCFSRTNNAYGRPHSADSMAHDKRLVTDKLQAMLNETHKLLADISASFLNGSLFGGTQVMRNVDKNNITVSSSLPAVHSATLSLSTRSSSASLGNNTTENIGDADDTKNIPRIVSLPPVIIDCTTERSLMIGPLVKTGQDFTLPLITSSVGNGLDRVDEIVLDFNSIGATGEMMVDSDIRDVTNKSMINLDEHIMAECVDDKSKLPENYAVLNGNPCYVSISKSMEENLSCDNIGNSMMIKSVIIPTRDDGNNEDPSFDSFGEKVTTKTTINAITAPTITTTAITTTTTTITAAAAAAAVGPLQDVIESLVDDLSSISSMMNRVVKLHHQHVDLHCIREEDDAVYGNCDEKEAANNDDNMRVVKYEFEQDAVSAMGLMDHKDIYMERYNERRDESERSSSAKETSITDGFVLGSTTCIEHSEIGNDCSVTTEICESSNEAKETTLTDGISLSLDEPMRPFVPELNLDSLQDVSVSSFKMTEDDAYEDNTNSVIETPTSSYQYYEHDGEVWSGECDVKHPSENLETKQEGKIIGRNYVSLNDAELECNDGEVNTPFGNICLSGSRCTTRRVNSSDFAWARDNKPLVDDDTRENITIMDNEDNNCEKYGDDVSYGIIAVTKVQACVRGFLTRRQYHLKTRDENHLRDTTDAEVVIDEGLQCGGGVTPKFLETNSKIIRNDFRGHYLGKRLCRENAIVENSVTISMDNGDVVSMNDLGIPKNDTLRHTGEFHDWIVLPLHDYDDSAMNGECGVIMMTANNDESSSGLRVCVGRTTVEMDGIGSMIECSQLYNDMKWFPRLAVFHFGLNKNMSDFCINHLVLLSNNGIVVDDDGRSRRLMSLPWCSSKVGVMIEEITDTPPGTLVEILSKVENAKSPSSSSSSSSSSSLLFGGGGSGKAFGTSIGIDEKVVLEEKEDNET